MKQLKIESRNYEFPELEYKDKLVRFMVDGYCCHIEWTEIFGYTNWYEQIVFLHGASILKKHRHGINDYSANSLEAFNRELKGDEIGHTFSGLSKFVNSIPEYGKDPESYILESIPDYDTLPPGSYFFKKSLQVPMSDDYVKSIKDQLETLFTRQADQVHLPSSADESIEEKILKQIPASVVDELTSRGKHKIGQSVKSEDLATHLTQSEIQILVRLLESYYISILASVLFPRPEKVKGKDKEKNKNKYSGRTDKFCCVSR